MFVCTLDPERFLDYVKSSVFSFIVDLIFSVF